MAAEYDPAQVASLRCVTPSICGDNVAEGAEQCDGTDLRGQDCLSQGFSSGTLQCVSDCTDYDTSSCNGGCDASDPPLVSIIQPSTGSLPGNSTTILAIATDADSGVKEVRFYYQYCPESAGFVCGPTNFIGTDNGPTSPYSTGWTFPTCGMAPDNRKFRVLVEAEDDCGNVSAKALVGDIVLDGRGC